MTVEGVLRCKLADARVNEILWKLTDKEQRHVRTAMRFLRFKVAGWQPLADAGHKGGQHRQGDPRRTRVTTKLAYGVARLVDLSTDDLLSGHVLSPCTCPHCGRPPDDFADEETVVEDRPCEAMLRLVK